MFFPSYFIFFLIFGYIHILQLMYRSPGTRVFFQQQWISGCAFFQLTLYFIKSDCVILSVITGVEWLHVLFLWADIHHLSIMTHEVPAYKKHIPANKSHDLCPYFEGSNQKHLGLSVAILSSDSILPAGWNKVQVPKH